MNHCKDCKHWCRHGDGKGDRFPCELHSIFADRKRLPEAPASALTDGILGRTAPEFGCVLFEARETEGK